MSRMFTTEMFAEADRIDAWRWNAEQICGDCRIKLPKSSFYGRIEVRTVGGLKITRFSSSPLAFWKWPADNVSVENRPCIVITQLSGVRQYLQNGVSVLLKPGDSTVIDAGRPWCSTCSTDCTRLYLRVPRWSMENYLQRREIPIAERIPGTGVGATLCRLARRLYDESEHMTDDESMASLDAYFRVLGACIGRDARDQSALGHAHARLNGVEQRGRIQQFIEAHLSEPAMRPSLIASALGISVRHVHRLFSMTGNSLGDYIRLRRLEGCRNDLANPLFRDKTITEIAFLWGFSDSAHFSHSFSKQFGSSPRQFRTEAAEPDRYPRRAQVNNLLRAGTSESGCTNVN